MFKLTISIALTIDHRDQVHVSILCFQLGEVNPNLTSLYDMVTQMFNRQTLLEAELVATKQELNRTLEKLKIGNKHQ